MGFRRELLAGTLWTFTVGFSYNTINL